MILPLWLIFLALVVVGIGALGDRYIQERKDCKQVTKNLRAMHEALAGGRFLTPEEQQFAILWRDKLLKERAEKCGPLEE